LNQRIFINNLVLDNSCVAVVERRNISNPSYPSAQIVQVFVEASKDNQDGEDSSNCELNSLGALKYSANKHSCRTGSKYLCK